MSHPSSRNRNTKPSQTSVSTSVLAYSHPRVEKHAASLPRHIGIEDLTGLDGCTISLGQQLQRSLHLVRTNVDPNHPGHSHSPPTGQCTNNNAKSQTGHSKPCILRETSSVHTATTRGLNKRENGHRTGKQNQMRGCQHETRGTGKRGNAQQIPKR